MSARPDLTISGTRRRCVHERAGHEGAGYRLLVMLISAFFIVNCLSTMTGALADGDGGNGASTGAGVDTGSRDISLEIMSVPTLKEDERYCFEAHVPEIGSDELSDLLFEWYFDDPNANYSNPGTVSGMGRKTAEHSYTDSGLYDIRLTVSEIGGEKHEAGVQIRVENVPPVPEITIERPSSFEDEKVRLSPLDSRDTPSDRDGLLYQWELPGEEPTPFSKDAILHRTFSEAGGYHLTLRAKDDDGAMGVTETTLWVHNQPPLAFAGMDVTVGEGEEVRLSASGSLDTPSDRDSLEFCWDLGDGTMAFGAEVTHTYPESRSYLATVTVTDDDGGTTSDHVRVEVQNRPPEAEAVVHQEGGSSYVTLDATGSKDSPIDMDLLSYTWSIDDEIQREGEVVGHGFDTMGDHEVVLQVEDPEGERDEVTVTVKVSALAPEGRMEFDPDVMEDERVSFDPSGSMDRDGEIVSFHWNFGDGEEADGDRVNHSYSRQGTYTVSLTLTDDTGLKSVATEVIHVRNARPVARMIADRLAGEGQEILFDASASNDTASDRGHLRYFWDFGDGTLGQGRSIRHVFQQEGENTVSLTVMDDDGLVDRISTVVMIITSEIWEQMDGENLEISYHIQNENDIGVGERFIVSGEVTLDGSLLDETSTPILEDLGSRAMEVTVILMETGERARGWTGTDGSYSLGLTAPDQSGTYTLLVTARLGTMRNQVHGPVRVAEGEGSPVVSIDTMVAGTVSGTIMALLAGIIGGTDIGRWKFFALFIPLYSRIKKTRVLDHFERGRIYEHIRKNPGDNYSSIRRALDMRNGTLAHHLKVLEANDYITSRRDGMYKRFYPKGMKVPKGRHMSIQERILELIISNPRITQKEIAKEVGVDRSTVNYHIKILMAMGVIRSEKEGRRKYYYFVSMDPWPYKG